MLASSNIWEGVLLLAVVIAALVAHAYHAWWRRENCYYPADIREWIAFIPTMLKRFVFFCGHSIRHRGN